MPDTDTDKSEVIIRLAKTPEDLDAAQRLRYKVFYEEYAATPDEQAKKDKKDRDEFDEFADHLIVCNRSGNKEEIVGTYRLLRRDVVEQHGQFYSSGEYDLSKILSTQSNLLELGRSCVLPEYRTKAILQLLWDGIAEYVIEHNTDMLFGCGSLHGTDINELAMPLSYMYHHHRAPDDICVRALDERYIDMNIIPKEDIDIKTTFSALPPLIKGYLRIGAMVGDGAVIDHQFNTTDIFIVMPTTFVTKRYKEHYERKAQKPLPGAEKDQDPSLVARGNA